MLALLFRIAATAFSAVVTWTLTLSIVAVAIGGAAQIYLGAALALLLSLLVASRVWLATDRAKPAPLYGAGMGALVGGAIGFAGGFFGPMIFAPDANQGPLLGIFITGPLGVLVGAIAGYFYRPAKSVEGQHSR